MNDEQSRLLTGTRMPSSAALTAVTGQIPKLIVRVRFPSPAPHRHPLHGETQGWQVCRTWLSALPARVDLRVIGSLRRAPAGPPEAHESPSWPWLGRVSQELLVGNDQFEFDLGSQHCPPYTEGRAQGRR